MSIRAIPLDVTEMSDMIDAETSSHRLEMADEEGQYAEIRDIGIQQNAYLEKEEQGAEILDMDWSGRTRAHNRYIETFPGENAENLPESSYCFEERLKQDVLEGSTQNAPDHYMLSDPERLCQQAYECLSVEESAECPVVGHIGEHVELQVVKERTPTKSSSTEISTEPAIPSYADETREDKLRRFQMKRKKRNWIRKVYYDCRKKVADSRLRIKGRFITRVQAEQILGMPVHDLALEDVKILLEKHFDAKQLHKS